ncbi:MAG: type III-B CRISPR module-associated protein Cmr5 [Candidatus Micrarchaeota archaeon]|nr:type III-B CRISPR module-associated protein Cmr5 [Candidatus Micrarchaeota archaeon]
MEINEYALKFINEHVLTRMNNKKEFRSRVRDLYHTAYFDGLIPTVVFALAKATEDKVKNLDNGKNELNKTEEGYGFFILAIFKFLKEFLHINIQKITTEELIRVLKDKGIENKTLIYMRWLKYFAEAKIETGE